jgi:hypothetical protein
MGIQMGEKSKLGWLIGFAKHAALLKAEACGIHIYFSLEI